MKFQLKFLVLGFLLSINVLAKEILIKENEFKYFLDNKDITGQTIQAKVNDSIRFVNMDSVGHIVYTYINRKTFMTKTQKPKALGGEDVIIQLVEAGDLQVTCPIHDDMLFNVKVEP